MRVRAIATGVYGGPGLITQAVLRHPDAVFDLVSPSDFAARWMVEVDPATPLNLEGDKTHNLIIDPAEHVVSGQMYPKAYSIK